MSFPKLLCWLLLLTACNSSPKTGEQAASQKSSTTQISFFQSFDGNKIAYTDEGTGDPLILVHGFISNGDSWRKSPLRKRLLAEGFPVIIPDLRGNGLSAHPQEPGAYQDNAEIKDLVALADHLQLDSFGAIGYSRGSIVLTRWLVEDQRINRAVLGGMGIDFIKPDWDRRIAFADAFSGRAELSELTRGAVEYAQSIDADLKVLGMLQDYQPVCSPEELQTIQIPVLVICGDQDVDNGDPQALQEALPNASLQIVEGDHNHTHQQENFAKAVTAFFSN